MCLWKWQEVQKMLWSVKFAANNFMIFSVVSFLFQSDTIDFGNYQIKKMFGQIPIFENLSGGY
jgi:hypothetical protein